MNLFLKDKHMEKEVNKTKIGCTYKRTITQTEIHYNNYKGGLLRDKENLHKGLEIGIRDGRIRASQKENVSLLSFQLS